MTPTSTCRLFVVGAVAMLAACSDNIPTTPVVEGGSTASLSQGQGRDRIEAIFQRVSPAVMEIPGTVFSDNDERIGKLVIGIEHRRAEGAVRAALARAGVAAEDYVLEETQPIVNMATLRDVVRPVVGGLQIHFTRYLCTIGFNADVNGQRSFITNSHCTGTQGGVENTVYYQPSSSIAPTVIATEVADPVYVKGGACPRGKKCRYSDASRAVYSSGVASTRGSIAATSGPNNGSLTIAGSVAITAQAAGASVGATVNKIGRTTGWTQGRVDRTCVNTSVQGSQVLLFCQTFVSNPGGAAVVGAGDSGSSVWTGGASGATLVGLLWGGSSDNRTFVFSPLSQVVQELGAMTATR
jgi:hypothetical protein